MRASTRVQCQMALWERERLQKCLGIFQTRGSGLTKPGTSRQDPWPNRAQIRSLGRPVSTGRAVECWLPGTRTGSLRPRRQTLRRRAPSRSAGRASTAVTRAPNVAYERLLDQASFADTIAPNVATEKLVEGATTADAIGRNVATERLANGRGPLLIHSYNSVDNAEMSRCHGHMLGLLQGRGPGVVHSPPRVQLCLRVTGLGVYFWTDRPWAELGPILLIQPVHGYKRV